MKIFITGVAGFIGSNLAEKLLVKNYSIVGLDNFSQGERRNVKPFLTNPAFTLVEGDVRDEDMIAKTAGDADVLVHLAAFKIPRYGNAMDTLLINSRGTESVLKAAIKNKRKVVFASTSDVYGKNPNLPFSEHSDLYLGATNIRRWAYAGSKLLDEYIAFTYAQEFDLPVVGLRFFGSYGPGQNLTWWGGPQSVFIGAALKNEYMEIHGDGKQTRSFTYIDDTIDGIVRVIESEKANGHVFNIGNTKEISIHDLATLVWKLVRDDEAKLRFISYQTFGKYDDVRNRVPDISKAREILGFVPKFDLQEGLTRTIAWQKGVKEDDAA
jgi:UDP-glucose 4-epimerase